MNTKIGAEQAVKRDGRAAYMLAWRDRVIALQKEMLAGREEEARILAALLQYCLFAAAKREEPGEYGIAETGEMLLRIPRGRVREFLEQWSLRCSADDGNYLLYFSSREEKEVGNAVEEESK